MRGGNGGGGFGIRAALWGGSWLNMRNTTPCHIRVTPCGGPRDVTRVCRGAGGGFHTMQEVNHPHAAAHPCHILWTARN